MSGLLAPSVAPHSPAVRPEVVLPRPKKPHKSGLWIGLVLAALLVFGAYAWYRARTAASSARAAVALAGIRTAKVTGGPVERTLRLTGVTAAANYASLVTPRLRGSRSDYGCGSGSTTTSSSSASSSSGSTSTGTASSGTSSAPNASAAFTAATTRVSSSASSTPTTTSASTTSSTTASSALGSSGLGSTSDSLPSTTGGGGGSNDFDLTLQHVAPPGSLVHKGGRIAEFDRQYMLLRLDDYQASVIQSEASLKKRKADLEVSHKSHEQLVLSAKGALEKARLDLKTIPVLSDIDAAKARLAFQQAEAKYQQLLKEVPFVLASEAADTRNSELDLEEARLEQKRAEANAGKMLVNAPIDGLVVMQSMFRGGEFGQIQQGDELWPGQFYMQIVDPRSMVINATVNQADVADVRVGQRARIRFDAYPDLLLPAHVQSVAAMSKPGNSRPQYYREVAVRLKIDQMDNRVIPDLSVSAEIILDTDERAEAAAPVGAIFHDRGSDEPYVLVRSDAGWQRRNVEVGLRNNLVAALKGVNPGEVVALENPRPSP